MASLIEEAQAYQPKKTKNIADLDKVDVTLPLYDGEGVDDEGKPFTYKYIEVNGEEYRVPGVVLGNIKDTKEARPDLKYVKVKRTGEGKLTRYTVIGL